MIKGVEDGGSGKRMPTTHQLITAARKYSLDLVLETREQRDSTRNNLELPQEINETTQLNRHNARKNAHRVRHNAHLNQIRSTIPPNPQLMPFSRVVAIMEGLPHNKMERPQTTGEATQGMPQSMTLHKIQTERKRRTVNKLARGDWTH
jgi:hypothetical protein